MNDFQRGRSESQTIMLSHHDAPSCELCALLLDHFCGSDAEEVQFPLELSYWLATREGYFMDVYDIHFKPSMAEVSLKVRKVRLAIQWVNWPGEHFYNRCVQIKLIDPRFFVSGNASNSRELGSRYFLSQQSTASGRLAGKLPEKSRKLPTDHPKLTISP
jgi:hypothetical protein